MLYGVFCISHTYSEGFNLEYYKTSLLQDNSDYKLAMLNYELAILNYKTERRRWLPQPYISLSPSVNFNETIKSTYTNSLGTSVGFSQKLPFGNSINGSI